MSNVSCPGNCRSRPARPAGPTSPIQDRYIPQRAFQRFVTIRGRAQAHADPHETAYLQSCRCRHAAFPCIQVPLPPGIGSTRLRCMYLCYSITHDVRMPLLPCRDPSAFCAFGRFSWIRARKVLGLRSGVSLHADGDKNGRKASKGALPVGNPLLTPLAGLGCLIRWSGNNRRYVCYRLPGHMILAKP